MKKRYSLFLLLMLVTVPRLYAQVTDYDKQWKQVDELVKKGLTKSAADGAAKIYEKAKKENNDPQLIKALNFRVSLNTELEENANVKAISLMEKEITTAKQPARSILYSILAEMYWQFMQQNRYKLYNRTQTDSSTKKEDILTWGLQDLHNRIGNLYRLSIKEEEILQQSKLEPFDVVIRKGNVRYLRPTLYDLLAHRALDYFKNNERDITRPSYAFEIKDEKALAPVKDFIAHRFINKDSSSLHYNALLLFQRLLRFHINDTKPDALIEADIERLNFVKQYGVTDNETELYIKALENIVSRYPGNPAVSQANFFLIQEIYNTALNDIKKEEKKYTIKYAKDLLEDLVKKFPGSEGGINAKNLLLQILHKELSLTSEKVNVPGLPFRTLVGYKNINGIHLRIIQLTPEFKKSIEVYRSEEELWNKLTSQKSIRTWKQDLPLPDDYRSHSAEIKIDGLPTGEYALLASYAEDFSLVRNPLSAQYFHVSNISYINNGQEYFVLNRTTGAPLEGAKVQIWNQRYDYNTRQNIFEKLDLYSADKNGYLKIRQGKANTERNIRLEITWQNDKLFLSDYQYNYYYNSEEKEFLDQKKYDDEKARIFLFTDRSIYRPGQLVYFKGIGITQHYKTKKNQLLSTKDSIVVLLYDANNQKVDSLNLLLNEFGSFNGKFRLPENLLNGNFRIEAEDFGNSASYFSVEEYKRPKFYTEFEKVKGTYRVNEKIKITGFAKAYAGNNIDGANVKYRVTRIARFLYPWRFWRIGLPQTPPMEITNGEIKTGADGKFSIEFQAIPDLSIDKNDDPVFDYRIEADVTDINGETRSATTIVPVGYKALNLQVTLPYNANINIDSLRQLNVSTKNLSGEFEPSKVELKIYRLKTPQRLIRSRYWAQPDQYVMSKEEFLKYFPLDEYNDENKKETWEKGSLVYSLSDSTNLTGNWQLAINNKEQGWYVAEATSKDKYGQEVKDVKYFQLYDMRSPSLPAPAYTWNANLKFMVEPGDKAAFINGTSAANVFVIQQVNKSRQNAQDKSTYDFHTLNNEKKIFEFPVTEEDRGGFEVNQFFIKDNRFYSTHWNITVPWTNKQLDITFETYRDKTLPGSEEKWKVKISGYKGQKVAAEMLASMYDASLDQFKTHSWNALNIWPGFHKYSNWNGMLNFTSVYSMQKWWNEVFITQKEKIFDQLKTPAFENRTRRLAYSVTKREVSEMAKQTAPPAYDMIGTIEGDASTSTLQSQEVRIRGNSTLNENPNALFVVDGVIMTSQEFSRLSPDEINNLSVLKGSEATALYGARAANGVILVTTKAAAKKQELTEVKTRKNFNETAFFFPDLRTDKDGNIEFSFTMPEALTQWKLMTLAHTKDLSSGMATHTVITQKEIMIQPNAPRFVREGDKMEFSAKVVNMTDKPLSGMALLQLLNASTMQPVDGSFKNIQPTVTFNIPAGQSTAIKFSIEIPYNYNNALVYRIVAKAGEVSDGEEAAIPVLTNRMLVTETMPLPVRGTEVKNFTFEKLLKSGTSSTLTHFALTTEFTTNPAWYAVQALPYLMEYPYECAEQTFNRYYANSIASKIINSAPKIKAVFEKWKITDTSALLSNLQKNEELKSVLLQETPWVLQAQSEAQQKKNIALLFDIIRMNRELESSINKLKDMQSSNGGFVWFKGGPDDRYMTQYIITGIGHLKKLGALSRSHEDKLRAILITAIPYLDKRIKEDYDYLLKQKADLTLNHLGYLPVHYLYMRSFFPEYAVTAASQTAFNYYQGQAKKYWLSQSRYMQGLLALSLQRSGDNVTAKAITRSLKENSINNEELGMYWKEWDNRGWWWYQAPIESQAVMIEAFNEIDKDQKVVDDLKTWLLKNKQTNNWRTTKATADACYALLLQGTDWLSEEKNVTITLGNTIINSKDEKQEAGTGYFKTKIEGDKVKPEMGNISVKVSPIQSTNQPVNPVRQGHPGGQSTSWGAVYWQYFENLDKITFAETPLKLSKKLFIEKNSDRGPVLIAVNEGTQLTVGDKIKVRIELRVDRDMEYVHMKDMRASCMEPVNVISQYKYQGGLGYYESTKDASTNFFFNYLNKGTYVFEYPLFVTHNGNFSNGITTIQCMYAPEFTSHSEGVRVNVAR